MATLPDYTLDVEQPFMAAAKGFQLGFTTEKALQDAQIEAQNQRAEQQRKQQFQSGISSFFAKPPEQRKYDDLAPLMVGANKQQFDALKEIGDNMNAEKKEASQRFTGQTLLALEANPDVAIGIIDQRINAETDPGQKQAFTVIKEIAKVDPKRAGIMLEELGAATFGKTWYDGITAARQERRAKEEQPLKVRKLTADAIIGEAQAKFAPEKFGLEIDLTQSQIEQAKAARLASNAAAKASGAQAQRLQAEANQIAAGVIPADKRPDAEGKLRKEYSDQTKPYQDVKSAYGRILAVSDPKTPDEEAAADLALVFNFMKMQDPGSTVNTSEFANAQNAAGVPDRLRNVWNNLKTGGRLNAAQRKAFRGQAENLYKVAGQQEATVRTGIERIAKGYGLNTENIFFTPTETAPTAPGAAQGGLSPAEQAELDALRKRFPGRRPS